MQNQQIPLAANNNQPVADQTAETPVLAEFNKLVAKAVKLEYDPKWANGTGYFNHAVHGEDAPKDLDIKKHYTFETDTGRKGLIFPTPYGNVVVFQRYYNARHILASNMPRLCEIFFISGRPLTLDDLVVIGGGWMGTHIGRSIAGAIGYDERRKKYEVSTADEGHSDLDGSEETQG